MRRTVVRGRTCGIAMGDHSRSNLTARRTLAIGAGAREIVARLRT